MNISAINVLLTCAMVALHNLLVIRLLTAARTPWVTGISTKRLTLSTAMPTSALTALPSPQYHWFKNVVRTLKETGLCLVTPLPAIASLICVTLAQLCMFMDNHVQTA